MHALPEQVHARPAAPTPFFDQPVARQARFGLIVVGLILVVAGLLWLIVTGTLARSQLNQVRSDLPKLRAALSEGDIGGAQRISRDIDHHARNAHALTTGPAWWTASNIPVLGYPLATSRVIAAQASRLGRSVLPSVISLATDLSSGKLQSGDGIDLAPLIAAEPTLDSAAAAAESAANAMRAAPQSWLGFVDSARRAVMADVSQLQAQIAGASRAIHTAVPMLGHDGTRRYFVAFQNEAESRGLGGVPGSFAIVEARDGQLTFTHYGNDLELLNTHVALDLGSDFAARYRTADPTYSYPNSDISPDFSYAARIWAAMWEQKSGQHVDGALAVDPTALSAMLKVTGPTNLPSGFQIRADNIVALSEQKQYQMFPTDKQRRDFLTSVAKAITKRLFHTSDAKAMVKAISQQASQRRFAVWSSDPTLEANIAAGGYGGLLPAADGRPVSGFVVVNATGGKLDYYLDRTMSYQRVGCTGGSTSVATFTLTNRAPRSGLPSYVTLRDDHAPANAKPGDDRLLVTYYAGHGATIRSMTVDGRPLNVATTSEKGLVTATVDLELPVGATHTVSVVVGELPAVSNVTTVEQPLVRPMAVSITGSTCAG